MSKILDYVPQPDARTCQSACIAKMIGSTAVATVRAALEQIGEPGNPYTMGTYLKPRVKEYKFLENASINDMRQALKDGYQLITHGYFSHSGHVICIVGMKNNNTFICDDPWYEINFNGWTYAPWEASGNNVEYSAYGIYAACVVGQSADHAASVYNKGELNSTTKGAWVHYIRN